MNEKEVKDCLTKSKKFLAIPEGGGQWSAIFLGIGYSLLAIATLCADLEFDEDHSMSEEEKEVAKHHVNEAFHGKLPEEEK